MGAAAKPDLNDVKYDAFLANDRTLADPEVIKVEPGGRVLLRIINSSSMSAYHIGLGQLDGELTAVDGFAVAPVKGRNFPIAVTQRVDIRLAIPNTPASHLVLAVLEDDRKQTGIVLVVGNAPVARVPDLAKTPSSALTLDLESRLRALRPLTPRKADRVHTINLTGDMAKYIWSLNKRRLDPDCAAFADRQRRAGRADPREPDGNAAPDALARSRIPGRRDQRQAPLGGSARHRGGAPGSASGGGLRCQQPRVVGLPLPSALPS